MSITEVIDIINQRIRDNFPSGVVSTEVDTVNKKLYVYKHVRSYKISKTLFKEARDLGFKIMYRNAGKFSTL